jgi:hypothetical protein
MNICPFNLSKQSERLKKRVLIFLERVHYAFLLGLFVFSGSVTISARSLPQWSEDDLELLNKGKLIVGASLFMDDSHRPPRAEVVSEDEKVSTQVLVADDEEEVDPEYDATLIPSKYLSDYFSCLPVSYLVDPQRLFSNQETLDREGFLEYYADESEVDLRIYLFDGDQNIPASYSLKQLVATQYANSPLTAVVFYFLGNPARTQLLFGGEGAEWVDAEKIRKMLDLATIKAMEKSDPSAQMESLITQLSISIYWMEQEIARMRSEEAAEAAAATQEATHEAQKTVKPGVFAEVQPYLFYVLVGVISVLLAVFGLGGTWVWWRRSRRYYFPVLELPRRLGGDYAAGIGAVIGFHNKQDSPSDQRNQIPEYLTKL